jgi:tol-pal system protein YbgF
MAGNIMKKKLALSLFNMVFLAVLAGCATRRQVMELQMQVDAIRADQLAMKAQNAQLDSLFRANMDQSRKLSADFPSYFNQLDQRMSMVESKLEDAVTLINQAAGAMGARSGRGSRQNDGSDSSSADSTKPQAGGIDCQKIYNGAYADMVKERFDMAVNGYKSYIESCPNTALADNAQYWIGECYLSMKDYAKAQKAFEVMLEQYPASEKLAAAKLKLGRALYEQRQKTKARSYFEDVIKNYPGTDEALEATEMLARYR